MFADDYVETNYSERENDEVKPVNAKLNDKIDVTVESVAEENNVMVDSDREKYAEDDAADAKDVKSGAEELDELKLLPYDKINVDKMNFADAYTEKHDMIDVDKMRTEQMYDRMDFKLRTSQRG